MLKEQTKDRKWKKEKNRQKLCALRFHVTVIYIVHLVQFSVFLLKPKTRYHRFFLSLGSFHFRFDKVDRNSNSTSRKIRVCPNRTDNSDEIKNDRICFIFNLFYCCFAWYRNIFFFYSFCLSTFIFLFAFILFLFFLSSLFFSSIFIVILHFCSMSELTTTIGVSTAASLSVLSLVDKVLFHRLLITTIWSVSVNIALYLPSLDDRQYFCHVFFLYFSFHLFGSDMMNTDDNEKTKEKKGPSEQ